MQNFSIVTPPDKSGLKTNIMKKPKLTVKQKKLLEFFNAQRELFMLIMKFKKFIPDERFGPEEIRVTLKIMKAFINWSKDELEPTEKEFLNANGLEKFIKKVESYAKEYNIDLQPNIKQV